MFDIAALAANDQFMRHAGDEVLDDLDLIELRIPFDVLPDQQNPVHPVTTFERLNGIGIGDVIAFALR